jgi:hypothetical protein
MLAPLAAAFLHVAVVASPFATEVLEYAPAPGQLVNNGLFNDPARALGPPLGGGTHAANNDSLVSLGGFGGLIVLGFDHRVMDHAANPLGMDFIIFGNAFWVGGNPQRRWAEAGHVEISRDDNGNGLPDDPWYLIPGSHIDDPAGQFEEQTWDNDSGTPTIPPANLGWWPAGAPSPMTTSAYRLPALFEAIVVDNPEAPDPFDPFSTTVEGVFGYADVSPTLILGDFNADNDTDDPEDDPLIAPERFYTVPDDPVVVGVVVGGGGVAGGGDAFDIAWAIDAATGQPADLDGFDFIRVTVAVNAVDPLLGEKSAEIDAVADVLPALSADLDGDGDVDVADFAAFGQCYAGAEVPPASSCPVDTDADLDFDGDVDPADFAILSAQYTGSL